MTGTNLDPSVTATDFFGNLTGNVTGNITGAFNGTTVTASGAITGAAGTVSLPEFTFTSDTDSGIYRIGANNLGIAVNATKILDIATTGLAVTGALSSTGALTGLTVDGPVGSVTPAAGAFTTLSATTSVANTGTQSWKANTVAATGATQGGAAAIAATLFLVRVTVTASTQGVKLPTAVTNKVVWAYVPGTVGVKIYPPTGGQINAVATNSSVTLAAGKGIMFQAINTTHWYSVTAATGA